MLMAHERVVEDLMARGAVLPLRFGTTLGGEEELAGSLESRHDELVRALERVQGRVELGLRVVPAHAASGESRERGERSGRAYMLERLERHRRSEAVAAELHEPLAAGARASRLRAQPAPPAILVAAYLVDRDDVDRFRAQADALAAARDDVDVTVTGPWPPYSFSDGEAE
jgi:hypothetical protein